MSTQLAALLDSLYQGQRLSRPQTQQLFSALIRGELSEVTIAAMLMALKVRGEHIDEISGAADALRAAAAPFNRGNIKGLLDIVGTGGDGLNTINISTTAAFVAAAAGAKVAKHGNRSVSSLSGSSDLLAQLGVDVTMSAATASECLARFKLCFLFAPHYHQGIKHATPVRTTLKTRTIFNLLGPLINPATPEFMLLGVYSPNLVRPIAEVLQALGVQRAMVVHGSGLDEVALHGDTLVAELNAQAINRNTIHEYRLTPEDFGVPVAPITALTGGDPQTNAHITRAILQGQGQPAHTHAVAINAGCALYVSGICENVKAGTQLALAILASGRAFELVTQLAQASMAANPSHTRTGPIHQSMLHPTSLTKG